MTTEYQELLNLIDNDEYIQNITLPDIMQYPYCISVIELKNQQYYFEYIWNNRDNLLYLSIYKLVDDEKSYYLKNRALINNINLSKYIKNTDWEGCLYFKNIDNKTLDSVYRKDTIQEKFYIKYVSNRV